MFTICFGHSAFTEACLASQDFHCACVRHSPKIWKIPKISVPQPQPPPASSSSLSRLRLHLNQETHESRTAPSHNSNRDLCLPPQLHAEHPLYSPSTKHSLDSLWPHAPLRAPRPVTPTTDRRSPSEVHHSTAAHMYPAHTTTLVSSTLPRSPPPPRFHRHRSLCQGPCMHPCLPRIVRACRLLLMTDHMPGRLGDY